MPASFPRDEQRPLRRARGGGSLQVFGERAALREVSFDVGRGELLAVLGPNGAGKTTLLSILAGIDKRRLGPHRARERGDRLGPAAGGLYRRLTVEENLRLFARMEEAEDVEAIVERMLEQTGLEERRDDQVSSLSGGNQQRVNIAIGLLGDPSVLLLDEPSAGLDPRPARRLWEFVLGPRRRRDDGDLLDPPHRGGRALRRPAAGAGRRRDPLRRHLRPDAPRSGTSAEGARRSIPRTPSSASFGRRATDALAPRSRTSRSCAARRWSPACWSSIRSCSPS